MEEQATPVAQKRQYQNYIPKRNLVAVIFTVLSIVIVLTVVVVLCMIAPVLYVLTVIAQILCVLGLVSSDENPDYKVPWLMALLLIPVVGFMLFLMFYSRKLNPKYLRRLGEITYHYKEMDDSAEMEALKAENPRIYGQAKLLRDSAQSHLFTRTQLTYYPIGEEYHAALLEELQKAEKFIYMEYFIIQEGVMWDSILDILKEKAAKGVDVRVLYDDVGCMQTLPGTYWKTLEVFGIKAYPFGILKGTDDGEFNNRSHRKITVIDGTVGFTGGCNLADEYINVNSHLGHWKDVGLKLEGPGVIELTNLFLIDFGTNIPKLIEPHPEAHMVAAPQNTPGYIIPFGDGPKPMFEHEVGKNLIIDMLSTAERYAWFTSPYLIIDNEMCKALETAAMRGVDVRIITPHVPDKKIVFAMTRSFYHRLMACGVKIYEYHPGFIHAKNYLVDDKIAMVGTINLDYRSLVHHFENGVWMYNTDMIPVLKQDIEQTLGKSMLVTELLLQNTYLEKLFYSIIRIFAPMM